MYVNYLPQVLVIAHMAVWPALPIVPLHPSENVVVGGAITEAGLPLAFVTHKNPLTGLKAMSRGCIPTGMVSTTVFVDGVNHRGGIIEHL
jgi:hypothetical protein